MNISDGVSVISFSYIFFLSLLWGRTNWKDLKNFFHDSCCIIKYLFKNKYRNRKFYNSIVRFYSIFIKIQTLIKNYNYKREINSTFQSLFWTISLRTFSSQFSKENHEPQKQSSPDISLFPSSRRQNVSAKIKTGVLPLFDGMEAAEENITDTRSQSETWRPHQRSICKSGATIGDPIAWWHFTIDCLVIVISSDVSSYRGPRHIYRLTNRLVKAR